MTFKGSEEIEGDIVPGALAMDLVQAITKPEVEVVISLEEGEILLIEIVIEKENIRSGTMNKPQVQGVDHIEVTKDGKTHGETTDQKTPIDTQETIQETTGSIDKRRSRPL